MYNMLIIENWIWL